MKKQLTLLAFLLLGTVICFFSCKEEDKGIVLQNVSYAERYYLSETDTAEGAINISIQMEIPRSFPDAAVLNSVRSFLITAILGDEYVQYPNDSIPFVFARDLKREYVAENLPLLEQIEQHEHFYSFQNDHIIEGFPLLNDGTVFSYGYERYAFMGGANGLSTRTYYTFDLKNNKLITEQDVFVENFDEELINIFKQRIIQDSETLNNLEDLLQSDYWVDSIKPNNNFYFSDEGITYVFNPFEIAPHYIGQTEIFLPYSIIGNLLREDSPINYIIKKQS